MNQQRPPVMAAASAAAPAAPVQASVDADTVRRRFNFDWATSQPIDGLDTYWWWARSIRLDPNEVIADDDEGNLWSVPFTTDGVDEITFGTPLRVAETYTPIGAGDGVAATAVVQRRRQRVAAAGLERPTKRAPAGASAGTQNPSTTTDQEGQMDLTALREQLNLPDATDEEVIAAAAAQLGATPTSETDPDDQADLTQTDPAGDPAETDPDAQAAATAALSPETIRALRDQGLAVVDAEEYGELRSTVQTLSTERTTSRVQATLDQHTSRGAVYAHERERWRQRLETNFEATAEIMAELPVKVPVSERGHAQETATDVDATSYETSRQARFGGRTTTKES